MSSDSSNSSDEEWNDKKSPQKRVRKVAGSMNGERESRKPKQGSSTFIQKVFEMANCKRHAHALGFSDDGGSLEIRNASLLGPVLAQYFRHGHTSSFIRQLNNYGFKTISSPSSGNDRHVFAHPNFKRDERNLLELITRKAAMREKKRSKADVIKELQQREFEQQTRMIQLETQHHELLQRAAVLDSENKTLRNLFQTLKTQAGLNSQNGGTFDEKRFRAVLMDHQHLLNIHSSSAQQQHHQQQTNYHHHVLPSFPSSSLEDDYFGGGSNKQQHPDRQDTFTPGEGSAAFHHHQAQQMSQQHHQHHGSHHPLQHFHSAMFTGTNPNSPIHSMDPLMNDFISPIGSRSSSPVPSSTTTSSGPSPHQSASAAAMENARMELHEMDLSGAQASMESNSRSTGGLLHHHSLHHQQMHHHLMHPSS